MFRFEEYWPCSCLWLAKQGSIEAQGLPFFALDPHCPVVGINPRRIADEAHLTNLGIPNLSRHGTPCEYGARTPIKVLTQKPQTTNTTDRPRTPQLSTVSRCLVPGVRASHLCFLGVELAPPCGRAGPDGLRGGVVGSHLVESMLFLAVFGWVFFGGWADAEGWRMLRVACSSVEAPAARD